MRTLSKVLHEGVGFFAICLASAAVTVTTLYKLIF
jgi:hypothetical protein